MRVKSYSEFRQNLAAVLDSVSEDHEPVIITRDQRKSAVVLMSVEEFASLEESRYLPQSPRIADRQSIAELDTKEG